MRANEVEGDSIPTEVPAASVPTDESIGSRVAAQPVPLPKRPIPMPRQSRSRFDPVLINQVFGCLSDERTTQQNGNQINPPPTSTTRAHHSTSIANDNNSTGNRINVLKINSKTQ